MIGFNGLTMAAHLGGNRTSPREYKPDKESKPVGGESIDAVIDRNRLLKEESLPGFLQFFVR